MFELTNVHRKKLLCMALMDDNGTVSSHIVTHQFIIQLEGLVDEGYVAHTKKRDVQLFSLTQRGWSAILRFAGPKKKSALYKVLEQMKKMNCKED